MIDSNCTCSCKSIYRTITITMAPTSYCIMRSNLNPTSTGYELVKLEGQAVSASLVAAFVCVNLGIYFDDKTWKRRRMWLYRRLREHICGHIWHILFNGIPRQDADRKTFEMVTSTKPLGTLGSVVSLWNIVSPERQQQQVQKRRQTPVWSFILKYWLWSWININTSEDSHSKLLCSAELSNKSNQLWHIIYICVISKISIIYAMIELYSVPFFLYISRCRAYSEYVAGNVIRKHTLKMISTYSLTWQYNYWCNIMLPSDKSGSIATGGVIPLHSESLDDTFSVCMQFIYSI